MMRFLPAAFLVTACTAADPAPIERSPTQATRARVAAAPAPAAEYTGVVTSRRSSVVSAQVSARIEKLSMHTGQPVKAGELVVKLDRTEIENRLEQARSNEKAARMEAGAFGAQASAARRQMIAERRLNKLGVSSPMAVHNAGALVAQHGSNGAAAMAKAAAMTTAREQTEKDLARTDIVAPLDGVVTNIKAREGEIVQIGTPLARVFDPSDLLIRFAVPKDQRARIKIGQRVELSVEGNQRPVWATVTNISGAQEPPINFTVVEADIDDTKLAPGELAVASVGRVRIDPTGQAPRLAGAAVGVPYPRDSASPIGDTRGVQR
jgi:RND family efflux transporter MFP subunit